jgi:hypothetical protein
VWYCFFSVAALAIALIILLVMFLHGA